MSMLKKITCGLALSLMLFPMSLQAAKAPRATRDHKPVVSMGDRPGAITMRDQKQSTATKDSDKKSKKKNDNNLQASQGNKPVIKENAHGGTGQSVAPKRNLNAIYILPKGYKDITIKGKAQATKKQAAQLIAANNKNLTIGCSIGEIVDLYWEEAEREGIRPDMALSQALLETGFFNFGGSVEPWQHNYCGLGTIGGGVQGAAFRTPQEGVRAHIQHLLAYTSHDLPKTKLIDPRYDKAHNLRLQKGLITKWSGLNWTWAMGGEYAEKIINTHQLMLRCEDKEPAGMWEDHKKQQKELEKLFEKKMKERKAAEDKYRKSGTKNQKKTVEKATVQKNNMTKDTAKKEPVKKEVAKKEAVKKEPVKQAVKKQK